MTCANCGQEIAARRYHVHLSTGEAMEIALCESCRHKFVTADWVTAVV
ncbi:hypothetical protein [Haloarcula nitratireducens]|uniref:Small CPxCG-related zinc finger protein n=1 Tax=Haloarcula nitratireducens TaxID=2487749 RepID=A0AAW4PEM5_9EURY|nr:hypothetical protein [Halomicroarcula nitratireducens]MBX0296197.1 hypothetical protein [Halomicroarcula nitratireducens]